MIRINYKNILRFMLFVFMFKKHCLSVGYVLLYFRKLGYIHCGSYSSRNHFCCSLAIASCQLTWFLVLASQIEVGACLRTIASFSLAPWLYLLTYWIVSTNHYYSASSSILKSNAYCLETLPCLSRIFGKH